MSPHNDVFNCYTGSECARARCLCNLDLITKLARNLVDNGALDPENSDVSAGSCSGVSAPGASSDTECCGEAPDWRPFNTALKVCSSGSLFNIGEI